MRIEIPRRRPKGESIIPMINVVFLLLIFFLLTAQVARQQPFDLTPPDSASDIPAADQDVLYVSAAGELAYNELRGDAVWAAIRAREAEEPLEIRADAEAHAAQIASLLKRLREISDSGAQLVVNGG